MKIFGFENIQPEVILPNAFATLPSRQSGECIRQNDFRLNIFKSNDFKPNDFETKYFKLNDFKPNDLDSSDYLPLRVNKHRISSKKIANDKKNQKHQSG